MVFDILNYIRECPYLSEFAANIDFLGKNPYSLSVGGVAKDKIVKKYTDGDNLIESSFILKLRLPYGVDANENLKNSELIKSITEWLVKNSERGILPSLDADKIPISISAQFMQGSTTYLADTAVYTANIKVLYYKTKSL